MVTTSIYLHLKVKSVKKERKNPSRHRNILTKESRPERIKASHRLNPSYTYLQLHISVSLVNLEPLNTGTKASSCKASMSATPFPLQRAASMLAKISSGKKRTHYTLYFLFFCHSTCSPIRSRPTTKNETPWNRRK